METDFLLYGAGGHAKVIYNCILDMGCRTVAILDDNIKILSFLELPVYHKYESTLFPDCKIILSIGNNQIRKEISLGITHHFGTAIHPKSYISSMSVIKSGTVVFQNSVIQPSASIGHHCIINTSSVVEHDCEISDFVHISPNVTLCGGVIIGEGSHIGAASVLIPGIRVGKWATVGAGSVIVRDVPDFATVVGNPGRIIKIKENEI